MVIIDGIEKKFTDAQREYLITKCELNKITVDAIEESLFLDHELRKRSQNLNTSAEEKEEIKQLKISMADTINRLKNLSPRNSLTALIKEGTKEKLITDLELFTTSILTPPKKLRDGRPRHELSWVVILIAQAMSKNDQAPALHSKNFKNIIKLCLESTGQTVDSIPALIKSAQPWAKFAVQDTGFNDDSVD